MRKLTINLFFMLALLGTMPIAHADGVAVVDVAYLIDNAPQAQAASRDIEEEFGPAQQRMQEKQQEYQELAEKLQRDGLVMDEQEQQQTQQRLQELEQEIRQMEQQFREELGVEREQAFSGIQEIIAEIVGEIAEEEDLDVVVAQGVLYSSDRADLTERVLQRMEARYDEE